jgi:hypothetical protein
MDSNCYDGVGHSHHLYKYRLEYDEPFDFWVGKSIPYLGRVSKFDNTSSMARGLALPGKISE